MAFQKGDKVVLREDSEFYGKEGQVPTEGGVVNGDNGHGKLHIRWEPNGYNLYDPRELELAPAKESKTPDKKEEKGSKTKVSEKTADEKVAGGGRKPGGKSAKSGRSSESSRRR